ADGDARLPHPGRPPRHRSGMGAQHPDRTRRGGLAAHHRRHCARRYARPRAPHHGRSRAMTENPTGGYGRSIGGETVAASRALVRTALEEDLRYGPDITTLATVPADTRGEAAVVSRADGVVAGIDVALIVLDEVLGADGYRILDRLADGAVVAPGPAVLRLDAPARGMLTADRPM